LYRDARYRAKPMSGAQPSIGKHTNYGSGVRPAAPEAPGAIRIIRILAGAQAYYAEPTAEFVKRLGRDIRPRNRNKRVPVNAIYVVRSEKLMGD